MKLMVSVTIVVLTVFGPLAVLPEYGWRSSLLALIAGLLFDILYFTTLRLLEARGLRCYTHTAWKRMASQRNRGYR